MDQREIIARVLEVILRPVVRLCVKHSFKIKDLTEILKRVFVRVAVEELERSSEEVSVSRVRVMSGVHRAEAARIMEGKPSAPRTLDIVTKVMGQWRHHDLWRTAAGHPRVLTCEGMESEFVQLVRSVSIDLNPYTVLFEMERSGFVERTAQGVRLHASVYIPKEVNEGYALMADDVEDLMEAVQENIASARDDRALHIKTEYDNIPADKLPVIRTWIRREGSRFHERVRKFLSKHDRDVSAPASKRGGGRVRVALASFSRAQVVESAESQERTRANKEH